VAVQGLPPAEQKALVLGVLMNGGEMAASLAAPWPLALVINDLLQGQGQGKTGILHTIAGWFAVRRWRCCWSRRAPCS
jgi:hypothetical protein